MEAFFNPSTNAKKEARKFNEWLKETIQSSGDMDSVLEHFADWTKAPGARTCHPREEHLIPLFSTAAAAGADSTPTLIYDTSAMEDDYAVSGYVFN